MSQWHFVSGQKKHTQDGSNLVGLMKSIGHGRRLVRAVDVGCGDGIMAWEMLNRNKASFVVAIDILSQAVEVAGLNLNSQIQGGRCVVKKISAARFFGDRENWDSFDRFVINPPFFAEGSGKPNKNRNDQISRHDKKLSLNEWAWGAGRLLKTGGELYCVFPTERLAEALSILSRSNVEPKELWWLANDRRLRRFFLRAVRGAKPGMIVRWSFSV